MKKLMLTALFSAAVGAFATQALADKQPVMKKALGQLEQALESLKKAEADKGGHRVKAIELVEGAIAEVKAGIQFDNKN